MASMLSLALLQKKVPDGDVRNHRGAKKGGYTDHLAGPHLIPNVGREAMVPAECVKRQPRVVKKDPPKAPPPKLEVPKIVKKPKKKELDERVQRHRSRSRSRRRSGRSPSRRSRSRSERSGRRSGSSEDEREERRRSPPEQEARRAKSPDEDKNRRTQEEQQLERQRELEAYREAETRRRDLERVKLEAFREAQLRRKEVDTVRKKRLSGAFALDEDDIPVQDSEELAPKTLAIRSRSSARLSSSSGPPGDAPGPLPYAGTGAAAAASSKLLRMGDGEKVTAADLDGSQHDHKFSAVWKDWNAQKRDDPGEIAKQFMKIAAIKRRGFDPLSRGRRGRD